ncbi:MAG: ATP-binding protein [Desulfobacterales bacterium]|nr:ATP-binding protein [Desulfobacterales bacterium]
MGTSQGMPPVFAKFTHDEQSYFAMFTRAHAGKIHWLIGVYIPEDDYFGEILANSRKTLWMTLAVSILATICGLIVAHRITRPISELDLRAREIKNDPETPLPRVQSMFTQIQHTADTFHGMHQSILSHKRELQKKEKLHRTILDTATEAIFMVDGQGRVMYWNTAAQTLFGQDDKILAGFCIFDLPAFVPSPDPWDLDLHSLLTQWETAPQIKNIRLTLETAADTHIPTEISMVRICMDETPYTIAVIRDISLRKREEEEKLAILSQLKQAQKIESIGTLAGGIAHDFNNILTSIIGNAELLKASLETDPENRPFVDAINLAGDRARELVRQILAFSHQDTRQEEIIHMEPIIQDACTLLSASIPPSIRLQKEISTPCSPISGDPAQIHQVALNLMTNALHAMEDSGGILTVGLQEVELIQDSALPDPNPGPGRHVCYTVSDTGTGIDPAVMDKIFDPYFTTKAKGKGTGLGLAVIKGIVEHHGGSIRVNSTPGQGTCFQVFFPQVPEKADPRTPPPLPAKITRGSEHILLVDDQVQVLNIQNQILEFLGYRITQRTSPQEALSLFMTAPEHFDMVITDYSMHPMKGHELARKLKAIRQDIPIILCTGYNEGIDREEILASGIQEIAVKPIKVKEFSAAIRRCFAPESPT